MSIEVGSPRTAMVPGENSTSHRPRTADELREAFLKFYEDRGHLRMPAASLIPANDPTLLFTNSGMAQFKQYFSGELEPPRPRITTAQKSFRTTDIESVGDATHLTLFEMLGNFSFGDYFKKEACAWALDLMRGVLKFPEERLYFTVFQNDEEAIEIWRKLGVPADHIYRFGAKDNFWGPAGDEGPCGPCSEIHYYGGELKNVPAVHDPVRKTSWGPNLHKDFVELYNLVFTQLYHHIDGQRTELPKKNIDTGMGLERTLVVLQGVRNVYETSVWTPLIRKAMELSGREWGSNPETNRALSVVAEHGRSASFLIGDGVVPGNTGRGYVLRRLIRRGMLFGQQLGINGSFLPAMADTTAQVMGQAYPELVRNAPFIKRVLELEEERFSRTLEQGTEVLIGMMTVRSDGDRRGQEAETSAMKVGRRAAEEAGQKAGPGSAWQKRISGSEAFLLYDTYGFPVEVTREFAEERGLEVDLEGFKAEMEAQRQRGRAAGAKFGGDTGQRRVYEDLGVDETRFTGYHATETDTVVVGIVREGEIVQSAKTGEKIEVILRETPFYAEKGGQVGDTGTIRSGGADLRVEDTQNPYAHVHSHRCTVTAGEIKVGDDVFAAIDVQRRERIRRNHTATHLLHAALREVLGEHVRQAGSLVAPDRLRFDFTHMSPLSQQEIRKSQDRVNEIIRENVEVEIEHTTYSAAVQQGALAFFGDKYENEVRTVCIKGVSHHGREHEGGHGHSHADVAPSRAPSGCWSLELCGGTHMDRTGGIGVLVVVGEAGIGAGMRRIEAVTGAAAEDLISLRFGTLSRLSAGLKAPVEMIESRIETLQKELDAARRKAAELEERLLRASLTGTSQPDAADGKKPASPAMQTIVDVAGEKVALEVKRLEAPNAEALRKAGDILRDKLGSGVLVLGSVIDGQPAVLVMVTRDLQVKGFHAGNIAKSLAQILGGGGGGRPDVAQAGGKDPARLAQALDSAADVVRQAGGRK